MSGSVFVTTIILLVCLMIFFKPVQGGICWYSSQKKGNCYDILAANVTREDCCEYPNPSSGWSADNMDSGRIFLIRMLGSGLPCTPCRDSCQGVMCPEGKACMLRKGIPKCVCPGCKGKANREGPVCGNDGNSYESACRLKRHACRKKNSNLKVAYNGYCQSNCNKVICPTGEFCIADQNLIPHCVPCGLKCPVEAKKNRKPVCGLDGVTYPNQCYLMESACSIGQLKKIAYYGECKEWASCSNVDCGDKGTCLTDPVTNEPRCILCDSSCLKQGAPHSYKKSFGGPVCSSNNRTYQTWCDMMREACQTGTYLETRSMGPCPPGVNQTHIPNSYS